MSNYEDVSEFDDPESALDDVQRAYWTRILKSNSIDVANDLLYHACGRFVCSTEPNVDFVELLLANGADIEGKTLDMFVDYGCTPLVNCITNNRLKTAEILLWRGAEVNILFKLDDGTMASCLSYAATMNNYEMVSLLLKNGASIDSAYISPFKLLEYGADLVTMKLIFAAGIDPIAARYDDGYFNLSLLDYSFDLAVSMEIHNSLERCNNRMEFIRFMLQMSCLDISPDLLCDAVRMNAFRTLSLTYKHFLEFRRIIDWPAIEFTSNTSISQKTLNHAIFLKKLIQRTRSYSRNSESILKYINALIGDKSNLIPTLMDGSINAVRSTIAKRGRNVEDSLNELPRVPFPVKKKLCLTDLQKQFENSIV